MSNDSIVDKLTRHIERGLHEESDVTYLLIQIGKLLERDNIKANYPALMFYRNWVAHPTLSNVNSNPEMRRVINRFDALMDVHQRAAHAAVVQGVAQPSLQDLARQVMDSISLSSVERELNRVVATYPRFDVARVGLAEHWGIRPLLLRVVADIPLQAHGRHVRAISVKDDGRFDSVTVSDSAGQDHDLPLT